MESRHCTLLPAADGGFVHWLARAQQWLASGRSFVLATILATQGSAPQKAAAKMLVAVDEAVGTVGGGRLEEKVIDAAREMLRGGAQQRVCVWTLSAAAGQCCGGRVAVLLEKCGSALPAVALFGIGHVGREVALLLQRLPYRLLLFNTYPESDAAAAAEPPLPAALPQPVAGGVEQVAALPPRACVLIMTHSHELDFQLCEAALRRGAENPDEAFSYVGVIGSAAKAARFRAALKRRRLPAAALACPMGAGGTYPAEIAVSICAEVVACLAPPSSGKKDRQAAALMQALKQAGGA